MKETKKRARTARILLSAAVLVALLAIPGLAQQWGGRLVVIPTAEITDLDPYMSLGWANRLAKETLFEPLVTLSYDGYLEGRMASSWTVSDDGTTVTFYLRRGVTFHNGESFTAEDAKYYLL